MGPDVGSTVRHARRGETCDSERWGGADSEWQLHCRLHSSLADPFSILDRPLWKSPRRRVTRSPALRDTVMFLRRSPQTVGERSVPVQGREREKDERGVDPGKGGEPCATRRRFLSPPMTSGSSHHSLPTPTRSSTFFSFFFFFHISPPSPCCDRRLN